MKAWKFIAAVVLAAGATSAGAGTSDVRFSGITVSVVDTTPDDGIDPTFSILGGTLTTKIGTGAFGTAYNVDSASYSFTGWPAAFSTTSQTGDAFASISVGPNFLDVKGDAGLTGSFVATLGLSFDVSVSAGGMVVITSDVDKRFTAIRETGDPAGSQASGRGGACSIGIRSRGRSD